jgi:hypothetical protein
MIKLKASALVFWVAVPLMFAGGPLVVRLMVLGITVPVAVLLGVDAEMSGRRELVGGGSVIGMDERAAALAFGSVVSLGLACMITPLLTVA